MTPFFRLDAPDLSPLAEALGIALATRGTAFHHRITMAEPELTIRVGDEEILSDGLLMLDRIEALHPDQPLYPRDPDRLLRLRADMALLAQALARLDRVTQARDPQELDLAVHGLRQTLRLVQAQDEVIPVRARLTGADPLLAPLVWRLLILDAAFGLHLAIGFDTLVSRGRWLLARPEVAEVLTPARAARLLHAVAGSGAAVAAVRPDWSGALGPEAGRRSFPPEAEERKFHPLAARLRSISDHR